MSINHRALFLANSFAAFTLAALFSAPAASAAPSLSVLPGAAETPGQNGAYFSSTLWVTNLGTDPATVSIGLVPNTGAAPAPVSVTLPAGRSQRFLHALSTLFGANAKAGAITVTADAKLALQLTTQNIADPAGTYGLALTPVAESDLLGAGHTGHAIWVSQSADGSKGYRTNAAAALIDAGTSVEVRVFDDQGNLKGTRMVGTANPVSWQEPIASIAGSDLPKGRVEFKVISGRVAAYTAVVDNVTGDGIASQAVALSPTSTDLLLDGVARTPGANGTHWSTDVRLFNPNAAALTVTLDAVGFASGPSSILRTVPPNGLVEISDILAAFGMGDGVAGALRLRAASPFLAAGRTNNSDPTGQRPGTISAYQQPISFPSGLVSAPDTGVFTGLEQSTGVPGFRSNLALLGGPSGGSGRLVLSSAGLALGTTPFSIGKDAWTQQTLPSWFPGASIPVGARVDVVVEQGAVDAYVSRIDNGTGDAVVLRFAPLPVCPKPTLTLSAPSVACPGDSPVLTWQATPPDAVVSIDGIGSNLKATGATPITVAKDTTYTGRATSACGTSPEATATVVAGAAPVVKSFTSSPTSITPGQSVTLSLVSENGLTAVVDPGHFDIPLNGSVTVTPEGTMSVSYQVTVSGACPPEATERLTVQVGNPDPSIAPGDVVAGSVRTTNYGRLTIVVRNKGVVATQPVTLKISLDPMANVRYQALSASNTDPGWTPVLAIPGGSLVFTYEQDTPIPPGGRNQVSFLLGFAEGQMSTGTFANNSIVLTSDRDSNTGNNVVPFSLVTAP